jgi:peptidoglycan/LPS O-acetylase OafA/YrhL
LHRRLKRVTPFLSVYLDLVRFGAALVVMLDHAWPVVAPRFPLPWPGHQAVVVFFVLSGFVIAYVADQKETTLSEFALHRVARIWSVALPALALGALVSVVVRSTTIPDLGAPPAGILESAKDLLINVIFMGQAWTVTVEPPLDPPYWSLNYEVWYYIIFASVTYFRGWSRLSIAAIAMLVCGPKILIMLPCWLSGVYLYWNPPKYSKRTAVFVFAATVISYLILFQTDLARIIRGEMTYTWPSFMAFISSSNKFVGDYLLSMVIMGNFGAAMHLESYGRHLVSFGKSIRYIASFTFSIYLYHVPIMEFLWDGLGVPRWTIIPLTALGIFVLGHFTERNLPQFRAALTRVFLRDRSPTRLSRHKLASGS